MNNISKQKPHKPTKINIYFELKTKPNYLINDPNRYQKLLNTNRITKSTVSNLPLGSINKSHYNHEFYSRKDKPIINKAQGKSFENINNSYKKERQHSFIDRLKYSKSIEKMYSAKKSKKNLGTRSFKKKNMSIKLPQNNNNCNSFYKDNIYINTSSTNENQPKHNYSYRIMKPKKVSSKSKHLVNNEVQIISLSNEKNKEKKIDIKNQDIGYKIKKINELLEQMASQNNKMKEMADESYYSSNKNNQNIRQNKSENKDKAINTQFTLDQNNRENKDKIVNTQFTLDQNNNENKDKTISTEYNLTENNNENKDKIKNTKYNSTENNNENKDKTISTEYNLTENNNENKSKVISTEYNLTENNNENKNKVINNQYTLTHKIVNSFESHDIVNQRNSYTNTEKKKTKKNIKIKNKGRSKIISTIPFPKIKKIPPKKTFRSHIYNNQTPPKKKKINKKLNKSTEEDLYKAIDKTYNDKRSSKNEEIIQTTDINNISINANSSENKSQSQIEISNEKTKQNLNLNTEENISTNNNKEENTPESLKDPEAETFEEKIITDILNLCKKGYTPDVKKVNQDNFFIYRNFINNPEYVFLGVCDGHGLYGHLVSSFLANTLPQNMNDNIFIKNITDLTINFKLISSTITDIFISTNIQLSEEKRIDITYSGATCVSAIITSSKIICANVGDSRCVLGKFNGEKWFSKNLSKDHKPNIPEEYNRIIKAGGRVETYKDSEKNCIGPNRVWLKNEDTPGLAMSRSFGDEIAHSIGVISEPEIIESYLLKEDKFVIVGSDGLWEFISSDDVVNMVKDFYLKDDIQGALDFLYNESVKRWVVEEGVVDDVTILIVFLKEKKL